MTSSAEIAKLKRRIKRLKQEISFAREMMLPNQIAVYRAAMALYYSWNTTDRIAKARRIDVFLNACKRARGGK